MVKHFVLSMIHNARLRAYPRRISTSLSDNQAYPQFCLKASNDYRCFNNFRRHPVYNEILEHVPEELGHAYLEAVSRDPEILRDLDRFRRNDDYGNPRVFNYPGAGRFSPTTLRYVNVLVELKARFGSLDGLRICEIGVGYGGQCRVLNEYYKPALYCLVDIQPALALAGRYLSNYPLASPIAFRTMNEVSAEDFDLVVSNYAFSEIPRNVQDIYLHRLLLRSARGYITFNQITPPEFNSYSPAELVELIPGSEIVEEIPLTHPGNGIIVWG